jgi:hypothetical protein
MPKIIDGEEVEIDATEVEDWIASREYEDQAREWDESVRAQWEAREEWLDFVCGQPEEW